MVWYGMDIGYKVDRQKITSLDRWLEEVVGLEEKDREGKEHVLRCIAVACWKIWKGRGGQVFQKKVDSVKCIRSIQEPVVELENINSERKVGKEVKEDKGGREWKRLVDGWVKINCDGAYKIMQGNEKENEAGIGVVIRNEKGEMIVGISEKVMIGSSIEVEAVALREGVWLAA